MTWKPGDIFETETRRFILRSMTPADVTEDYIGWWNDPDIQAGFGAKPRNWGRAEAVRNIQTFNNKNRFHLGIYNKENGKLIGFFTLTYDPNQKVSMANFLCGDKSFWGTGVLIEVKVHLMDFMFNTLGAEKLETKIQGRNLPSIYNSKAMGFKPEGILRQHQKDPFGGRCDVYLFGLTKQEWLKLKKAGKGPYK